MSAEKKIREPKTRAEWQEAVDLAKWLLVLDSARAYGLVKGGPEVDEGRALEILARGKAKGIRPSLDCVERLTRGAAAHS
jgi:hypothetical protein